MAINQASILKQEYLERLRETLLTWENFEELQNEVSIIREGLQDFGEDFVDEIDNFLEMTWSVFQTTDRLNAVARSLGASTEIQETISFFSEAGGAFHENTWSWRLLEAVHLPIAVYKTLDLSKYLGQFDSADLVLRIALEDLAFAETLIPSVSIETRASVLSKLHASSVIESKKAIIQRKLTL